MKTIGIIGAMREEIMPLLDFFKKYEEVKIGGNSFYTTTYKNYNIIIAYSKIGKIHAALTCSIMALHFYAPMYLLLTVCDREPQREAEALQMLEKHIIQFNRMYKE